MKNLTKQKRELIVPNIANILIKPKWKKHLKEILNKEKDIDAVLFLQVPLNHLIGIATFLRKNGIPTIYYDGDLPVSLPEYGGYTFNFYIKANLSEFDVFITNSEGVIQRLKEMGATDIYVMHYGVDPNIYRPLPLPKDIDIFYAGLGVKFREKWINNMLIFPSKKLNNVLFVAAGLNLSDLSSNVQSIPMPPFNQWLRYCCRSKVTLNIARETHSMTPGTSSSRPFELAALGCCIVSNPYLGLRKWFEIGKELLVVNDAKEAIEVYKWLLADEEIRSKIGQAARRRILKEHTYRHRARQLLSIISKVISKK
jgi:spore maturation protein CgeB